MSNHSSPECTISQPYLTAPKPSAGWWSRRFRRNDGFSSMNRPNLTLFGCLLCLIFAGLDSSGCARAASANQILNSCEVLLRDMHTASDGKIIVPPEARTCWFYLSAIQDSLILLDDGDKHILPVCAPPEVTLSQVIRIFTEFARSHPNSLHEKAAGVAVIALGSAFPCSK